MQPALSPPPLTAVPRMALRIAFARALNLGTAHHAPMAKLVKMAKDLGLANARTIGQKGNLVFESTAAPAALERRLDAATKSALRIETEHFVRTPAELRAIVARNPLAAEAKRDPAHVLVYVLKRKPAKGRVAALRKAIDGPERVCVGARHLYAITPPSTPTACAADRSRTR